MQVVMDDQHDRVEWRDGVPVSALFDDPFYSLANGLAETRHVFLGGNRIADRAGPGFHIAELGFGTGLNLLATAQALAGQTVPVSYTSFEAFPMQADSMAQALSAFPELDATPLLVPWGQGARTFVLGALVVQVIIGDVRDTLPIWDGRADAWYLDGFSPAKNPAMWADAIMAQVGAHTAPGGTFATYTAAGHVRRALTEAGFTVTRVPGFGHKRHMSIGTRP
jgi:tRNA U34 5-methylaminomethyl-2-thiouridine-forming methyltransferase MnmC